MTHLLEGQVVIITGAGGGLGRAYALECGAQGAAVIVNDVDAAAAEGTVADVVQQGGRAICHVGSVGSWSVAEKLTETAVATFGTMTGLVNNAGVKHLAAPWEETPEQLERIVGVNLLGAMYCARHSMGHMLSGGGSIVNIVSGAQAGIPSMSAYGATKGALSALTYAWALEGAPFGIRVNAVSPHAQTGMTPKQADGTPAHRPAASSVAPIIAALLSPRCAQITGRAFGFNGTSLSTVHRPDRDAVEERDAWSTADLAQRLGSLEATTASA